jgi:tRNA nucleotidyltransferase (CCA-adding enzyme)
MHDLYSAVWANKILKKILPHIPQKIYLVGGCVRDLILGASPSDFDLVAFGPPLELAMQISSIIGGKAFLIDRQRNVARVAVSHGDLTIDVSPPRGEDITADLKERDITINAMALNPLDGTLIDPLGGLEDLRNRRIRLIAEKNLRDDPLRGLRCLRFSVQLKCSIDPFTMELLKRYAHMLNVVAPERIKHEFLKSLSYPDGSLFFSMLYDSGYVTVIFGEDINTQTMRPAMDIVSHLDRLLQDVHEALPEIGDHLEQELEYGMTRSAALRLAAFFIDMSGRSDLREGMKRVRTWCRRLAFSSKASHIIIQAISGYLAVIGLVGKPELFSSDKYRVLSAHDKSIPEMLLLALAFHGEVRAEETNMYHRERIMSLWEYARDTFRVHRANPLVNGQDIMDALSLPPGHKIGLLLREVERARAEGLIVTRQQALEYLSRNMSR